MKTNEIGHFPYLSPQNSFDKGDYSRTYIAKDENGKIKLNKNGKIKWLTNWKNLGEVECINLPIDYPFKYDEPLIDLQTAHDCYCADIIEYENQEYIYLMGSGWADRGFPFHDETFNPKKPFKIGKGCYALIKGKARDKFIKLAKKDVIPGLSDIVTENIKDDFCLP